MGECKLNKHRFAVIGGDDRSLMLSKLLADDGHEITLFGFDKDKNKTSLEIVDDFEELMAKTPFIIAPLPFAKGEELLNTPLYSGEISIMEVLNRVNTQQMLLGGHIASKWHEQARGKGIKLIDYFNREELKILNAIPTAEGAIQVAMQNTDKTVHGSNALVVGFGRVAKVLANMLQGIGANVYVCARDISQLALAKAYGYQEIPFQHLNSFLPKMELIFNSVPNLVIGKAELENISNESLIIDLASHPGGVDSIEAKKLGINTIWALALPGKVAPISAAMAIKETIYHIIFNLEV